MNEIENLKKIVNNSIKIPFIKPINLEKLSKKFKSSDKFPEVQSSFEFPPKSIELVVKILLNREYTKLIFFDIARLLTRLENNKLADYIVDKNVFSDCLQELFTNSKHYIQNLILKVTTKIFLNEETNDLKAVLLLRLTSKEFTFIQYCINNDFSSIRKVIKNQSLKTFLKNYGIAKILQIKIKDYGNYLLSEIKKIDLNQESINCYKNNLLLEDDLEVLYKQTSTLILLIENKKTPQNNVYIDEILLNKLGSIEQENSNWNSLAIPADLQERYKRLKGLFEFQRFVDIAKYLKEYSNLEESNANEHTNDAKRLRVRSTFWANYDERFASVKMWVSEEDYRLMLIDKPVDLKDIKVLKNIDNEACLLEFKECDLLIIEFFRQRDNGVSRKSLIFEDSYVDDVRDILSKYTFSSDLYDELKKLSSYRINHTFLWQGWVDKFLMDKGIHPNESILNGKKFQSYKKVVYKKGIGLESARVEALNNDRVIRYEDVISRY